MNLHCFNLRRSYSISFNLSNFGEISWGKSERTVEKEKENFCVVLTYFVKRAREIRKFQVAVVQGRLRNVQKRVMHVQSCCLADINLLLFYSSLSLRRRGCLSSLSIVWSGNFDTMVTWRHTSLYYEDDKDRLFKIIQRFKDNEFTSTAVSGCLILVVFTFL